MNKRLGSRAAIEWMVLNDDTQWVADGDPFSVTAALVADLFGKTVAQVTADLKKALIKEGLIGAQDHE
jgi:hypothetical protein